MEISEHFYSLKEPSEDEIRKNEEAREKWGQNNKDICRGDKAKYFGPSKDEMDNWPDLVYKPYNPAAAKYARHTGFFSRTTAPNLFTALWEHLGQKYRNEDNPDAVNIETHGQYWTMKVALIVTPDRTEEDEEEPEDIETEFVVNVRVVEEGANPSLPAK